MKLIDILSAHEAILAISKKQLPLSLSWEFAELDSQLAKHIEFRSSELKKILDKYPYEVDGSGQIQLKDEKDAPTCMKEIDELNNFDVKLDIVKPTINVNDNIDISIENVLALKPLVNFTK